MAAVDQGLCNNNSCGSVVPETGKAVKTASANNHGKQKNLLWAFTPVLKARG